MGTLVATSEGVLWNDSLSIKRIPCSISIKSHAMANVYKLYAKKQHTSITVWTCLCLRDVSCIYKDCMKSVLNLLCAILNHI